MRVLVELSVTRLHHPAVNVIGIYVRVACLRNRIRYIDVWCCICGVFFRPVDPYCKFYTPESIYAPDLITYIYACRSTFKRLTMNVFSYDLTIILQLGIAIINLKAVRVKHMVLKYVGPVENTVMTIALDVLTSMAPSEFG